VRLTYHIEEGPQIRVRKVLYSGYEHTRLGVIKREVEVQPTRAAAAQGQVVGRRQRRLYNMGSVQSRDDRAAKSNRYRIWIKTSWCSWRRPRDIRWLTAADLKFSDWRARLIPWVEKCKRHRVAVLEISKLELDGAARRKHSWRFRMDRLNCGEARLRIVRCPHVYRSRYGLGTRNSVFKPMRTPKKPRHQHIHGNAVRRLVAVDTNK